MKKKPMLDRDERHILESYERGEWQPSRNRAAEIARLRRCAERTLRKNRRINIRLSERDLLGIQTRAAQEGLPYQTFISSILHKYLGGSLVEERRT
ncbi:MAG: antitoxin [Planctomycetota bacterium]|nr:antitoxin [Planctomycetota bacterium]